MPSSTYFAIGSAPPSRYHCSKAAKYPNTNAFAATRACVAVIPLLIKIGAIR